MRQLKKQISSVELDERDFRILWSLWGKGKTRAHWANSLLKSIMTKSDYENGRSDLVSMGLLKLVDGLYSLSPKAVKHMSNNTIIQANKWEDSSNGRTSM